MIYEYENALGERREIVASMKNPPPEVVLFYGDEPTKYLKCITHPSEIYGRDIFRRVYTVPQIGRIDPGGAVTHKGSLPYSRTLPPTEEKGEIVNRSGHSVRRLKCGAYATMEGRRIIDSKEAGDRHASDAGFVRVK